MTILFCFNSIKIDIILENVGIGREEQAQVLITNLNEKMKVQYHCPPHTKETRTKGHI